MIEGPDPIYFSESEEIPPELIELMTWGIDEGDLISSWEQWRVPERKALLEKLKTFLNRPPSEFQLYSLLMYRYIDGTEAELLALIQDICRRLELSLEAAP